MYITEVSIKRPVVAWVMSLILIIFGIFVFLELPVRELPDGIQPPVVQVQTDYKSASAEIVDEEITQKLEDVIFELFLHQRFQQKQIYNQFELELLGAV